MSVIKVAFRLDQAGNVPMLLFLLLVGSLFFIRHLILNVSSAADNDPFHPQKIAKAKKIYEDERGYLRFATSRQLVYRAVMGQKFGRRLRYEEVVHNRDRNKHNNHPSNLWVFKNQEEHDSQHRRDAEKYGEWWSYNGSRR